MDAVSIHSLVPGPSFRAVLNMIPESPSLSWLRQSHLSEVWSRYWLWTLFLRKSYWWSFASHWTSLNSFHSRSTWYYADSKRSSSQEYESSRASKCQNSSLRWHTSQVVLVWTVPSWVGAFRLLMPCCGSRRLSEWSVSLSCSTKAECGIERRSKSDLVLTRAYL